MKKSDLQIAQEKAVKISDSEDWNDILLTERDKIRFRQGFIEGWLASYEYYSVRKFDKLMKLYKEKQDEM